jgi:hypothetical protein
MIRGLRRRESAIDFQDAHVGRVIGLPDLEVLSIAAEEGRILVSHDRRTMPAHFMQFSTTRMSPGLIIVDQDLDIGRSIEELLLTATVGLLSLLRPLQDARVDRRAGAAQSLEI